MTGRNRLANERSPYLLQHAANPVDWYPWGEEAFARARAEDKPIFLSIGYSTCHWCHVMERESFEDPGIADRLNRDFVSIKVDREERPDVDRVYMAFVQATTGSGGWPMTVFLTPELKPFYGGTYFPPTSRWGRPGFADLLTELARVWKAERKQVETAAGELLSRLASVTGVGRQGEQTLADIDALDVAVEQYQMAFDREHGGFGSAPKVPRPSELLFLLREHARRSAAGSGPQAPLFMAADTLRAMARGGMRDQIGGGFHRYSVDGEWRVPHFEKMLYDQAQLTLAYLEAAQATGDDFFATVAEDTLQYVLRDLADPLGGFYSAEDADSVPPEAAEPHPHRVEGAFYVWSDEEIGQLLGADAEVARQRFGIAPGGNALQDPQGEFRNRNILYLAHTIDEVARSTGRSEDDVAAALARIRETLFAARARRPRPHLDDKVITAWNGLAIAAFARAARTLVGRPQAPAYLSAAQRAAAFVRDRLWNAGESRLLRRYRDGEAAIDAYAEDYASLIFGLLELFQADGDAAWLEWALALQQAQDLRFWDEADAGWFSTSGTDPHVLLRLKDDYDGAEPAASSVAVHNLITLGHLTDPSLLSRAERTMARFGPRAGAAARAIPMMLAALSAWQAPHAQVVIVGPPDLPATRAFHAALAGLYRPFAVTVPVAPGEAQAALGRLMPFMQAMTASEEGAAAYVCRDFTCEAPITDPGALASAL
jgi:uncharacterized protein YyaL (SSP411 family)